MLKSHDTEKHQIWPVALLKLGELALVQEDRLLLFSAAWSFSSLESLSPSGTHARLAKSSDYTPPLWKGQPHNL